jgi:hypothetical protein
MTEASASRKGSEARGRAEEEQFLRAGRAPLSCFSCQVSVRTKTESFLGAFELFLDFPFAASVYCPLASRLVIS